MHDPVRPSPALGRYAGDTECDVAVVRSRHNDDDRLVHAIAAAGGHVAVLPLSRSVVDQLAAEQYDVVVVDGSTADFNVSRLCADIVRSSATPILVCLPAGQAVDEPVLIELFRVGVNAVVGADASPERVIAQIHAIVRLAPAHVSPAHQLVVGDVTIDLDGHLVVIDGTPVSCPPLLLSLLAVLAESPNRVVSTEALLVRVWGLEPGSRVQRVRVAVSLLRKLLGEGPLRPRIETVSLFGYRLMVTG